MVKRNTLLLLACLVWSAAGFNILRIGILAYPNYLSVWSFLLSALVLAVFQRMVFGKLVKKHTARIRAYEEERHFFLKFFDVKSFLIMAVMMSGGIWLRSSGLAPERFIAVFYTGLRRLAAVGGRAVRLSLRQSGLRRFGKYLSLYQKTSPAHRGRRGFSISRHDVTGRISGAGCGAAACRWR